MVLSIVIVSWNVADLLVECLRSIERTCADIEYEIIVVDNASTDGTVATIKDVFPGVQVIVNEVNVGFPRANNQGINRAHGQYILLLNPDTVVAPLAIQLQLDYLESHPETGCVGPKLLSADGQIQTVCARNFPTVSSYFFHDIQLAELFPRSRLFGQWNMEYWDHLDSRDIPCICGASMMIPKRVLDQVGGLDESHSMYFEDIEFCYRLGQAGLAIHYLAEAEVVHLGGKSSSQVLERTAVLSLESVADFMGKVYGPAHRLGLRSAIFCSALVRLGTILLGIAAKHVLGLNKKWFNPSWVRREFARFKWSLGFSSMS